MASCVDRHPMVHPLFKHPEGRYMLNVYQEMNGLKNDSYIHTQWNITQFSKGSSGINHMSWMDLEDIKISVSHNKS